MRKHLGAFLGGASIMILVAGAAMAHLECPGDFNGDQHVTIDEILTSVNHALNSCPPPELRFVDNGNGTVSDQLTGLMWEHKVAFDNSPVDCADSAACPNPHDADNLYSWGTSGTTADGTVFTVFLAQLNDVNGGGANCFAEHCDWRLPTIAELSTIVDYSRTEPAIDPVFHNNCTPGCALTTCACTRSSNSWSSTSYVPFPNNALTVSFDYGLVLWNAKFGHHSARAVRD